MHGIDLLTDAGIALRPFETYVRHAFGTIGSPPFAEPINRTMHGIAPTGRTPINRRTSSHPEKELETYALVVRGLVVGDQMVLQGGCFLRANYWITLLRVSC